MSLSHHQDLIEAFNPTVVVSLFTDIKKDNWLSVF